MLSSNQHLGVERVFAGDFTLKDWAPTFSLANGTLPKEASELQYPNRNNNRGLFAGTKFESTKEGTATFSLQGDVKAVWVNGAVVRGAGPLKAPVKRGENTIVIQLNDVKPDDVALRSSDVTFMME